MNKITLCGTKTCCPTLEKIDDTIFITDDEGGSCIITVEQGLKFSAAVQKLITQENVLQSVKLTS